MCCQAEQTVIEPAEMPEQGQSTRVLLCGCPLLGGGVSDKETESQSSATPWTPKTHLPLLFVWTRGAHYLKLRAIAVELLFSSMGT